jgi:menaquinone-dependent protoporphyrinogen oxidase
MEQILVAYGTKYGATAEIAERIGQVLREAGLETEVKGAGRAGDPGAYSAVVLGSAVYMGQWRKEAAKLLKENEAALAGKPVWIFSSGPTGEGDIEELMSGWSFPGGLKPIADRIQPRDMAIFHGAADESKMGRFDRWILKRVKAPVGDFRDWDAIEAWARTIAEELKAGSAA